MCVCVCVRLTGSESLLQEADLLTQGLDAVQLLQGVRQEAGATDHAQTAGHALLTSQWEESGERRQHHLQLLHDQREREREEERVRARRKLTPYTIT